MNQETKQMLEQGRKGQNLLAVYRDDISAEDFSGIPTQIGKELALFRRINDFQKDGWTAVRLRDITFAETMDNCLFVQRVMKGEHLADKLNESGLAAENWKVLFESIRKNWGGWVTLDVSGEDGEDGFYLGRITGLTSSDLYLRPVLADGTPAPDDVTLSFEEIQTASVGGRYLETYRRYCKK